MMAAIGGMEGTIIQEFDLDKCLQHFKESYGKSKLHEAVREHFRIFVPLAISGRKNCDSAKETRLTQRLLFRPLDMFLCNGDPDVVYKQLKNYDTPPVLCAKVFKMGEPTYSCRDCGMDATCVLCIDCFQNSTHKKHRYKMSTSSGGGYCDCGDGEAWKSDPFCDIHKKGLQEKESNEEKQPMDCLPTDLKDRAWALFEIVIRHAIDMLTWQNPVELPPGLAPDHTEDHYVTMLFNDEVHTYDQVTNALIKAVSCSQEAAIEFATIVDREGRSIVKDGSTTECESVKKIIQRQTSRAGSKPLKVEVMHSSVVAHQMFALKIFAWLRQVIDYSDGIRQLFTYLSIMPSTACDGLSVVEKLMLVDTEIWKIARMQSHQLIMAGVLTDQESKKQFAILFTKMYSRLMKAFAADDHDHSFCMVSESVQIYTVPSLARMLITDYDLLKVILETFLEECRRKLNDKGKLAFDKTSEGVAAFRRAQYMLYDLKYALLGCPNSADWNDKLRKSFIEGFASLLDLLKLMQGMDACVRHMDLHVEYEPEWESAFTLQLKFADALFMFQDWCRADKLVLVECCRLALRALATHQEALQYEQCTVAGLTVGCIKYDFSVQPVSVHLPVTRMLAGLLASLTKWDININDLFSEELVDVLHLMEPALQCLVLVSQVHAGMWRRNGLALQNQVFYYHSVKCRTSMFDKDIVLMQTMASLMDSNVFLIHLIHKFSLLNWVKAEYDTDVSQEDSVKQIISLAEHFLSLVIALICERYVIGVGDVRPADILQREIIHQLCVQPLAHSELTNALAEDPYRERGIEDTMQKIAHFRKPTGLIGKGVYELKDEYYAEYSPYFYHYSKTDMAKSEEVQRKRLSQKTRSSALYPPALPSFLGNFEGITNILQSDVLVYIIKLILTRSTARWSKSWSESQLEMALFLIGLGIEEEKKCVAKGSTSFSFVSKATNVVGDHSIYTLLECLITHQNMKNKSLKDDLVLVFEKLTELHIEANDANVSTKKAARGRTSAKNDEKLDKESKRKSEIASKRRERIMAQMAKMQRNFIKENKELFESTSTEIQLSTNSSMDVEPNAEELTIPSQPVAVGTKRSPSLSTTYRQTCILCQEEQDVLHNDRAMVLCAFVQKSTVLSRQHGKLPFNEPALYDPLFTRSDLLMGTHTSACGHIMHADCWRRFFEALMVKESRRSRVRRNLSSFDISKFEFLCPLCETISNTVLPLLPPLCTLIKDNEEAEVDLSLDDWLDGIQKTVKNSIQQHRDRESQEESFLFVPCPLSSVTKMMTESVARNFQLLFDYVYDNDDASAHFSDSITEMLKKFSTDVYSTGLGVLPDDENLRVPVMVWNTAAYTLMCVEHGLRDENKPLFGSLSYRQAECISALIRMAAVCGNVNPPSVVKKHCMRLLSVLVCGMDYQLHDSKSILDIDMFHMLVSLCFSLPTLYIEEDSSAGTNKKMNIPSGRLNELHALHLVLAAHLVQIFITMNLPEFHSMETEEGPEVESFLAIFQRIRANVGLDDGGGMVQAYQLIRHCQQACLPFLRCTALFFHYLTDVPAPLVLFETAENEFEILCGYLSLPTSLPKLLTQSSMLDKLLDVWSQDTRVMRFLAAVRLGKKKLPCYPLSVNQLLSLPHDYSELINRASTFSCPKSLVVDESRSPAMCLVCGEIVCSQSYCCQVKFDETKDGTIGAATAHSISCGAGIGIFIRVRESQVLLLSGMYKGSFTSSPYLDDYGETDELLRRGNPLHLCEERFKKLQKLWLSHGITEQIVHLLEASSSTNYMTIEWHLL